MVQVEFCAVYTIMYILLLDQGPELQCFLKVVILGPDFQ